MSCVFNWFFNLFVSAILIGYYKTNISLTVRILAVQKL